MSSENAIIYKYHVKIKDNYFSLSKHDADRQSGVVGDNSVWFILLQSEINYKTLFCFSGKNCEY